MYKIMFNQLGAYLKIILFLTCRGREGGELVINRNFERNTFAKTLFTSFQRILILKTNNRFQLFLRRFIVMVQVLSNPRLPKKRGDGYIKNKDSNKVAKLKNYEWISGRNLLYSSIIQ